MDSIQFVDPSMTEKVIKRKLVSDDEGVLVNNQESFFTSDTLPESIMSEIEKYLGDGNASVTVSADVADSKDFGCKAGVFYSVSVKCDNTMEAVQAVHDILVPHVQETVAQDLPGAMAVRDAARGGSLNPSPKPATNKPQPPAKKAKSSKRAPRFQR